MTGSALQRRFGRVVRAHREQAGISQEALAFKAGLHRTYVSMLERGVRNPTLMVIDRLSRGLPLLL